MTQKAAERDLSWEITAQYAQAEVTRVKSVLDIRPPESGLEEGIESGKRVLVISRSRKFVEQFHNTDPGAVCPTFRKLSPVGDAGDCTATGAQAGGAPGEVGDDKLLLLTRSAKVDELLALGHNGNTIVAWGLNCERVTRGIEFGTASYDDMTEET